VTIIPTTFIDRWNRKLHTNQYSVSDYARTVKHGQGVPGIFIKYDIEPLTMHIRTRTTSFIQFLVRLAGTIGGFWTVAHWSYRAGDRMVRMAVKMRGGEETTYEQYAQSYSSSMRPTSFNASNTKGRMTGIMSGAKEKASNAWAGNAMGHRPTASVAEKIFSGESLFLCIVCERGTRRLTPFPSSILPRISRGRTSTVVMLLLLLDIHAVIYKRVIIDDMQALHKTKEERERERVVTMVFKEGGGVVYFCVCRESSMVSYN
jgi:hypothetical protein